MHKRLLLTQAEIKTLPPPERGRDVYRDTETRGLELRVTSSGIKTWSFKMKINGRSERVTIGQWPDVSVANARARAQGLRAEIAAGRNPVEELRGKREQITLGELYQLYLETHVLVRLRVATQQQVKRYWKSYLSRWSAKPLGAITQREIKELHAEIGLQAGPYAANRAYSWLHAMIEMAIRDLGWPGPNPARGIRKFREDRRSRFLKPEELAAFFDSLAVCQSEVTRDFVWLALLTGARKGNVYAMRYDQLSLAVPDAETWTIPAEEQKSKDEQVIPLHPLAVQIIRRRKKATGGAWVLPGTKPGTHLQNADRAWRRIVQRAGLGHWEGEGENRRFVRSLRIHDLRRSLASWQVGTGSSLPVVGATLGHHDSRATSVYARVDLDPVRAAIGKAVDAMLEIGGVTGEVVELEPHRAAVGER